MNPLPHENGPSKRSLEDEIQLEHDFAKAVLRERALSALAETGQISRERAAYLVDHESEFEAGMRLLREAQDSGHETPPEGESAEDSR